MSDLLWPLVLGSDIRLEQHLLLTWDSGLWTRKKKNQLIKAMESLLWGCETASLVIEEKWRGLGTDVMRHRCVLQL